MAAFLPYVYALILASEATVLTYIYATDPPKASDPLGLFLGWAGLLSMTILLFYSVVRRSVSLRRLAKLSTVLQWHIFMALQGVMFVMFHCAGILIHHRLFSLNPGYLNLMAVLVIFFSGLFGRYMYGWLPRTLGGEQMESNAVDAEIAAMKEPLPAEVESLWKDVPPARGFFGLVAADFATRTALRKFDSLAISPELKALARRRVWLERRKAVIATAQRTFGFWIVLHRPLAAAMYLLSVLHIVLSYMFSPALAHHG